MNFSHAVQGASPSFSMAADDFIRMNRVQAQLQRRVDQLSSRCGALENEIRAQIQAREQGRQQAEQLSRRCCDLENALRVQVQARQTSESRLFQEQPGRQAREDEIVALREQLHHERLRANGMCRAGRPVLNPASIPLRIVPVGDNRMDQAQARGLGLNESVNPSNPSEPSPGPVPSLSQYPHHIPEKDREAIRARMLKYRGSGSPGADTPAPAAASPQDMDTAPRAPSSGANVPGPCNEDDMSHNEAGTSPFGQQGETAAADVDSEETEDDCAANDTEIDDDDDSDDDDRCAHDTTTSASSITPGCPGEQEPCDEDDADEPTSLESSMAAEHVVTNPAAFDEDRCVYDTTTSASSTTCGCPGKQEPCDEDDANGPASLASPSTAAEHVVTLSTAADDNRYADDTTTSSSGSTLGCRRKQEPRDEDNANEPASLASSPTAAEHVVTNSGLALVKIERGAVPCTTIGSAAPAAPTTAGEPSSSAANEQEVGKPAGLSSLSGGVVTAPSVVKTEAISSRTSAAVSRQAPVSTTGSTSPSPISFSHQPFSSSLNVDNCSSRSVSDSTDTIASPDSVDDREAGDVDTRGGGADYDSSQSAGRDRFSHNTFCSSCKSFRTEQMALAKCAACPRTLCRTCAGRKGEKVPRGVNADDIVFCPDKCLCQKRDSEFTKPSGGKDLQAHLLKQLQKHDLAYMFLEPVKVEENPDYLAYISRDDMIDLGTMITKMKKRKQYQSSRGKLMFRRDLKRMWGNCWKFAGHTPESSKEEAAGIVRCTIILEAMVDKFYEAYMEKKELVTDQDSWLAEQERRHNQKFVMCANPSGNGMQDEPEPPVAAAEFEDNADDDMDLDEENRPVGATVCRKRKLVFSDGDDDCGDGKPCNTNVSADKAGLDPNICALAAIGEHLKHSSGETRGHGF